MNAIEIKNLTKRYGNSTVKAVDNLSLTLKPGEVFGFLGPNGAGKSTTIKSLVGIYPFQEGDILIDGVSIKLDPLHAKKHIGYVSDNHAVFERLTGREYVNHMASLYNADMNIAKQRCDELTKIFKLETFIDQPIKSYSHGMKQKICIIAALIHEPKLWVLDEPMMGLDPQSTAEIIAYMREH
jgi:ABC-2 type transport system ATP-binding protein